MFWIGLILANVAMLFFVPAVSPIFTATISGVLIAFRHGVFLFHVGMSILDFWDDRKDRKKEQEKAHAFDRLQRTEVHGESPAFLSDPDIGYEPPISAA